jgi:hypothetical protein
LVQVVQVGRQLARLVWVQRAAIQFSVQLLPQVVAVAAAEILLTVLPAVRVVAVRDCFRAAVVQVEREIPLALHPCKATMAATVAAQLRTMEAVVAAALRVLVLRERAQAVAMAA